MGKLAFISELPFNGKVDRNHQHMRTEFAQFCALKVDHYCFYQMEQLQSEYDHIILDTAPYGIISDSASLLRLVDGIIVVSRFNVTTKRELKFTLDGLAHLNADVVGLVLNAFNPKKSTDYYTNYNYYQRTYSEYYKYKE